MDIVPNLSTPSESSYNDPFAVSIFEKFGDIGCWAIPAFMTMYGAASGVYKLPVFVLIAGLIQTKVVMMLKKDLPKARPRPFYFGKSSEEDLKSFPSSHTAGAFLAVGIAKKLIGLNHLFITILALASLVGISRYVSKKHWSIDILAGACIGFAFGFSAANFSI